MPSRALTDKRLSSFPYSPSKIPENVRPPQHSHIVFFLVGGSGIGTAGGGLNLGTRED
ncbi:uncharacterized protein BO95DRAFT_445817 [Aspergillus brunneoviolaceus CBS 621.78]|uniref:Uncharacterized protein n=1 Tax=Aspergillus brunneoviolaceus CBS 621.78 TaxID=1450534 RepID=A0ACD1G0E4_9EURO|nr:hypothetical protein BO95DRAFT_445817 [Aspergillus brunneoviolaceus CBS 621.78]RAH42711.1 hypothetical protein BO95DRAFT_445817 [Aspergillus brunneoviolaceus CBS 621.78]